MHASHEKAGILLVDDKPQRLLSYEAVLEGLNEELVCASSGEDAVAKVRGREFAVVLMDVSMPGLNGFETAALIREIPGREHTPIVFITGIHVTDLDRLKGYEMGAADYVYVPVVPEILRSKVRILVEFYRQRHELSRLNERLSNANAELARAHEQLKAENTRELKSLNRSLKSANTRLTLEIAERRKAERMLKDAARRKDEFISILAHELRNPLSAIQSGIDVMRVRPLPKGKLAWARSLVERQLRHLVRLIDDLLDVSRITNGRVKLQREKVELASVIRQSIDAVHPIILERKHEVVLEMPPVPVYVDADVVRLTQVFGNLLTNASKYMEPGGTITVSADRKDGDPQTVVVRVQDEGAGLSEDILDHVFDLFAQANPTGSRTPSGLGIGLALVRSLVELHGGTVRAASEGPERGAEFAVELPVSDDQPTLALVESRGRAAAPPLKLLIIDDNEDAAEGLAVYFELNLPYAVRVAGTGVDGIREALEFAPDVVLLDIGLPDIDGYEVARRLRSHDSLAGLHLIAVTGFGSDSDRKRAEEALFDRFMVKPVDLAALEDMLDEYASIRGTNGDSADARTSEDDEGDANGRSGTALRLLVPVKRKPG